MFYGYHRVSTKEQNLDRGVDGIKLFCEKHNYPLQNIFVDKISGKTFDRPRYTVLKEDVLREGDTLVIYELDRLARNKKAICDELRYYEEHGIRVMILDIPTTTIELPEEADKMNKMVKKLLSLNQLEFGNGQVHLEHFDLQQVVQSVLSSSEILFRQKEVTLSYDGDHPVYVWADEYMTEEVVMNYVSNALNHIDGEKIIEVKIVSCDGKARVSVFNTGKPIPEEDIDKIWSKFYKVDKARTREYGGNGIGLSIVKAIMEAHNQAYGVKNYDNGVEFWFELDEKTEN